jgi:hypothetical protein
MEGGLLVVSVIGELDQSTAPDLGVAQAPTLVQPA